MFSPQVTIIAIVGLVIFCVGGLLYALLAPKLSGNGKRDKRMAQISASRTAAVAERRSMQDADKRRKSVQDSLKDLENKQKAQARKGKNPPIGLRIQQAGLGWSRNKFLAISVVTGLVVTLLAFLKGLPLMIVLAAGFVGMLGLPRWFVDFRRKRRMDKFIEEMPNAVDVIVRGVKAGLPIGDCLKIISMEATEPVRSEFKRIVESQALGLPLTEAVEKLPERIPLPEANFFATVIAIQQQAGGNLSEALGNLSRVLRERKKMRGKIKAVSMEAKASAGIIGSLPIIVTALIYLTSPGYIMMLFTEPAGNIILGVSAMWMSIGVLVMKRMINFDI